MGKYIRGFALTERWKSTVVKTSVYSPRTTAPWSPKGAESPGWETLFLREKHKAARQAYLYCIDNHKPKVDLY